MNCPREYVDLDGHIYSLSSLDAEERRLMQELLDRAREEADWTVYRNYWMARVGDFYEARGLTRQETHDTIPYRVSQDLCSRIGIKAGVMRPSDYRDELEGLIRTKFRTRREFCAATGLAEDMLSHVLAKRKHLAVDTLADALARIGYSLHIVPRAEV